MSSRDLTNVVGSYVFEEETREAEQELTFISSEFSSVNGDAGPKFSLMEKRAACRIVADYVDVTPDNIVDPKYAVVDESFPLAAFVTKSQFHSDVALKATTKSTGDLGINVYVTTVGLDDIRIDHTIDTTQGRPDDVITFEVDPSCCYLPKSKSAVTYLPEMFVILKRERYGIPLRDAECLLRKRHTRGQQRRAR
ncbi:hypothetical protein EVAR_26022_1 [Eumeta japonica]|uniref:Uncharacterized protein n=1 Tax=Eumeta variegata TaxID=151549 RepID=A0A4C1VRC5_EUMVA|nr:hypothetical protein EVAR_26022_1 [Eumeta japonica]